MDPALLDRTQRRIEIDGKLTDASRRFPPSIFPAAGSDRNSPAAMERSAGQQEIASSEEEKDTRNFERARAETPPAFLPVDQPDTC